MSSSTIPTVSLDTARRMRPRPPSTVYGRDSDIERPTSPSLYDSRPFSLTYTNQPEPIMRMSMSDETSDMFSVNNQTQESGLVRKEPSAPPIRSLSSSSSMESSSLYQDSGFASNIHQLPSNQQQRQQQQQQSSTMFYHDEDEDLIDPHQRSPSSNQLQQTNANVDPASPLLHHRHMIPNNNNINDKNSNNHSPVVTASPITTDTHHQHSQQSLSSISTSSPNQRQQRYQPYSRHDRIDEQKEEEEEEGVGGKAQDDHQQPSSSAIGQHHQQQQQQQQENGRCDDAGERLSWQWDPADYVDWMNQHMDQRKISHVTDLRTGESLVELLEGISGKQVRRPATTIRVGPGPLTSMQMLDNIVAAFKYMGREGVVVDGRYNIKGNKKTC